jgi:hypothetical protein
MSNTGALTEQEFWEILAAMPVPQPIFYRLYYDDQGNPMFYSTEDLPGNYITVDQETYNRSPSNVRVIQGQLVKNTLNHTTKLIPAVHGTPCSAHDVCVIAETGSVQHWSKRTYEKN